jgi:hypothetical protein
MDTKSAFLDQLRKHKAFPTNPGRLSNFVVSKRFEPSLRYSNKSDEVFAKNEYDIIKIKKPFKSNDLKGFIFLVGSAGQMSIALCKAREVGIYKMKHFKVAICR